MKLLAVAVLDDGMISRTISRPVLLALFLSTSSFANSESEVSTSINPQGSLPVLTIQGRGTANVRPATTFESVTSNLDFDPRLDFQARNMAEAQGDVNIRGGIFEATGFRVGGATIFDPQTGHYATELPIAPEMLGESRVYTGVENALRGFNSTAGTLTYGWSKILEGGSATLGAGDHNLNFQRVRNAWVYPLDETAEWTLGYEAGLSRSESDGTVNFSDHDFDRSTGRVQLLGPSSQTDLFAGYQSKFFGQYGMYTGDQYTAFNPYETENIKTRLFILNHEQAYQEWSAWEATAYYRRNSDHYVFNRFAPNRNFVHETEVASFSISGLHEFNEEVAFHYNFQVTADEIESSTLEQGNFTSRTFYKLSLLPEYRRDLNNRQSIVFKAGASFDDTNRNGSEFSPIAEVSFLTDEGGGDSISLYLSFAKTTQVVGYGAIGGSETSGLFRSNHDLLRETSRNVEIGYALDRLQWSLDSAVFYRWDDDLVDWSYTGAGARAAENMDVETFGLEIIAARYWNRVEAIVSYSYLKKDEEYRNPGVIGSFYALNFPEHRATMGLIYTPSELFEVRIDNEWRDHRESSLRTGPTHAVFSHVGLSCYPTRSDELEVFFAFDKPWDDDFQEIPGTPGRSDQFSLGVSCRW